MNEGIYKVGDILEFPGGYETRRLIGFTDEETRGVIFDKIWPGFDKVVYTILLREKSGNGSAIRNIEEEELWTATKRVGHVDISELRFEKQESPSPEFISAFAGGWILALMNQKDKDCTDSERFHKYMDILNRVDELQDQTEKIRNLEEENSRLKKGNDELRQTSKDLRNKVGDLHAVIDELTREKMRIDGEEQALENENEELRQINKDLADKVGELNAIIGELTRDKTRLRADQGAIKDTIDCVVYETQECADKLGRLSNWLRGVKDED